jgi:hypothetical protein
METWETATDRPGYRRKVVQRGAATIVIYRPILSEAEAAKAQEKTRTALEGAMREHYSRTTRQVAV